jgi:hypothetical protein
MKTLEELYNFGNFISGNDLLEIKPQSIEMVDIVNYASDYHKICYEA